MPKASTFGALIASQVVESDSVPLITNAGDNKKVSIAEMRTVVGPGWSLTINAANEAGATDTIKINAAIVHANSIGATRVFIPSSMMPYDATAITFNAAVQMVREGGDFSVYDFWAYGASGDGITDETVACQTAITHANGKKVYAPAGTYLTTGLTVSVDSTALIGDGASTVLKAETGSTFIIRNDSAKFTKYAGLNLDPNNIAGIKCFFHDGGWYLTADQINIVEANLPATGAYGLYILSDYPTNIASYVSTYHQCVFKRIGCYGTALDDMVTTISFTDIDAVWVELSYTFCINFVTGAIQEKLLGGDRVTLEFSDHINFYGTDFEGTGTCFVFGTGNSFIWTWGADFAAFTGTLYSGSIPDTSNLPYTHSFGGSLLEGFLRNDRDAIDGLLRKRFKNVHTGSSRQADVAIGTGAGDNTEELFIGVKPENTGYQGYIDSRPTTPGTAGISALLSYGLSVVRWGQNASGKGFVRIGEDSAGSLTDAPVVLTSGVAPALDASAGAYFTLTITSNIAVVVAVPTNPPPAGQSQEIVVVMRNGSGGALTTPPTFNTGAGGFKFAGGSIVNPTNGTQVVYQWRWDNLQSFWYLLSVSTAL